MTKIPVCEPSIGELERAYVNRCLDSGWISSGGEFIDRFEDRFAAFFGRKYGVAVNSGTNALIAAVRALEIPSGREVILPSFTIISCALACIYNDLVPVFVDAEPDTWNIDAGKIEARMSPRTAAVMAVHIYGHPCEITAIEEICERHSLHLIEDFAEAMGSKIHERFCGGFGRISCASFYSNKVITTGEGGMCITDDSGLRDKLKGLRNLCFQPGKRFVHEELGFNFRMTNVQAAIGSAQLEQIERHIEKKRWIGNAYNQLLGDLEADGYLRRPIERPGIQNTYWMYGVVLNESRGIGADKVCEKLDEAGIQTRPFFYPLHLQPAFRRFDWFREESLPVSENLYEYGFYLPSGLTLEKDQLERVADSLHRVLHGL
jgi:perosamine synthetase